MKAVSCMVVMCPNKGKIDGVAYFELTKNRQRPWLQSLGLDPQGKYPVHTFVCSAHFREEETKISSSGKMILRSVNSLPTMNLGPNANQRKILYYRKAAGLRETLSKQKGSKVKKIGEMDRIAKIKEFNQAIKNEETTNDEEDRLHEILSKQKGLKIKIEESDEMGETEKQEDFGLTIKNEETTHDEEQRLHEILFKEGTRESDGRGRIERMEDLSQAIKNEKLNIKNEETSNDEEDRLHEIFSMREDLLIKTEEMGRIEKMEDFKQTIENEELIVNDEETPHDEEQRLHEMLSHQKSLEIKIEESDEMDGIEEQEDIEQTIKNEKLIIKDEDAVDDEEHRTSSPLILYLECNQCDYRTTNQKQLYLHLKRHEKVEKIGIFMCKCCAFQTIYKENLKSHIARHKKLEEICYGCNQCNYQTNYINQPKQHNIHCKGDDSFKCDQCDYKAVNKNSLQYHVLEHNNFDEMDMYKCDDCDYQTNYKYCLTAHHLTHKS